MFSFGQNDRVQKIEITLSILLLYLSDHRISIERRNMKRPVKTYLKGKIKKKNDPELVGLFFCLSLYTHLPLKLIND